MIYRTIDPIVDETKDRGVIVVRVNDIFVVSFKIAAGAWADDGYRWLLDQDGSPVLQLMESKPGPDDNGLGTHQWRFKAVQEGTGVVRIGYKQSWDGTPSRRFRLTVTASATAKRYSSTVSPYL